MAFKSVSNNSFGPVKWLLSETTDEWLIQAISNPLEVLLDHAHCERKAAGFAFQLMFRYMDEPYLSEVLSPLVREELEHFERVLHLLKSKGKELKRLPAPPYGSILSSQIRKNEPYRMLDSFLVAGLIEARSYERMSLLAEHSKDNDLRALYQDLKHSEAKHFGIYWNLAEKHFDREVLIARLDQLSIVEANILSKLYPEPRIHS